VLEELDGYRLLQFLPRGDEILVSVFPQAIVEFFQHHQVGARHLRVDADVTSAFTSNSEFRPLPAATGWNGLPGDGSAPNLPVAQADNSALIENRLLLDHWHRELVVRRAEWEQNPTPRTGAALLRTMLVTGADPVGVARVREKTPRTGDHWDLVAFDSWYALYVGVVEHNLDWVREVFAQTRQDADEWHELTEAIEDFVDLQTHHSPDPADVPAAAPDAPANTREILAAVRLELLLARGRPVEALAELAQMGEPVTEFGRSRKSIQPWALLLNDEISEAIDRAQDSLAQARHNHDIEGIVASAYVLAVAYSIRGRTTELRNLLSSVLSSGVLPGLQRPQHVALLSIAAALAATEGRPTTGRTLAQQALSLQTGPGLVPLGSPTQAIAELELTDLPPAQAKLEMAHRLWAESQDLLEKRYLVSAYVCGLLALVANPTRSRAEALKTMAAEIPAPLIQRSLLLVDALKDGSTDALVRAANALADAGHVWEATQAYSAALNGLRTSGNSAKVARVHDDARVHLEPWGPEAGVDLRTAAVGNELTAREDEIARLAASGLSNQEIARRLLISVRTVENHLHRVFRKLGVDNRAGMSRALN
jgi:DNA-binding CsgD family transcriptional regulator